MSEQTSIKGLRLDLEPLEPLEHLSTHIQKRYFDQMEQLIDWEIIKSKAVIIRAGVKIVMQQFQHFFSKSGEAAGKTNFTTFSPPNPLNSSIKPSKNLDKPNCFGDWATHHIIKTSTFCEGCKFAQPCQEKEGEAL